MAKKDKSVDEMQARCIAVYAMSVIATMIHMLEKSKLVGEDRVATDVHRFLMHHNKIINKMAEGQTPDQIVKQNEKNSKLSKPQ